MRRIRLTWELAWVNPIVFYYGAVFALFGSLALFPMIPGEGRNHR